MSGLMLKKRKKSSGQSKLKLQDLNMVAKLQVDILSLDQSHKLNRRETTSKNKNLKL